MKARNIYVSGPMLQKQALKFAAGLKLPKFSASNGWLESFRSTRETGDVKEATIENWKPSLIKICNGYSLKDIFNLDETRLFYKAVSKRSLEMKCDTTKGVKNRKERVSIVLLTKVLGEKEKQIVIGKAKNPRCFKT
ncbi:hypothetical protein LAZ67_15001041 [Cordylochernes scorpioides]|uniref:HTH CENPB-type domain-containing protein n=1 Tax=Cordylochernes scorpioides TaxID=51811 RepID=A0ABY6L8H2_9ARAC|nr:hypothetical protein LAZ67_15001041 [Cordylochernes scorpioides]